MVRLLAAEERLHASGARAVEVPDGIGDVLRLRLARLDDDVRQLLCTAAVAGRTFDLDLLVRASGRSVDEVLDLLDAAVASHAVEENASAGSYRFVHALVRETLYGSLSVTRRGLLHARLAELLEPRLDADPDLVVEVAHHFVLGAPLRPALVEPAVRHSMRAARVAEVRGALDQALVHWEEALDAQSLEAQSLDAQSLDDQSRDTRGARRRYDVLLGLGRARHRRGDVAGSRAALTEAVELARSLRDPALMAEAATSFRGAGVWHWREFGTSDPVMVAVLEECLEALPAGPLRARVQVSLAMELNYEWRSVEAEAVGAGAVDAVRPLEDHELFADVLVMRTLQLWGKPGAAGTRIELATEALARPLSLEQELYVRFGSAAARLQLGDMSSAVAQMNRCIELTRRLRHSGADVPIAWWLFYRAIDAGDVVAAEALLQEALRRHRQSSTVAISDMEPMARLRLTGPGAEVTDEVVEQARNHANPAFRAFVAHALAESGRAEEGAAVLGEPVPDGAWDYASVIGDCLRVDTLAAAGHVDQLKPALDRIADWGEEFAVYGSTDCVGSVHYFIGRGMEALGDLEGARARYTLARDRNRAAGIAPWAQRAEGRLAALAR